MLLNFLIATTCTGFTSVAPSNRSLIVIHCESQSILGLRVTGRWHLSSSVQPCPGLVTGDPADEPRGFPDVLENLLSGLSPERGILLQKKMWKGHQDALAEQALVLFNMLGEDVGLPGVLPSHSPCDRRCRLSVPSLVLTFNSMAKCAAGGGPTLLYRVS